jgi:hypothetical protein
MIRYPHSETRQPTPDHRPARPFGVTLLTIWNGVSLGFMPVVLSGIGITTGDQASLSLTSCLSLMFSLGLIFTAIGAWRGHDQSRLGLLVLLILYYALKSFNTGIPLFLGSADQEQTLVIYGTLLRYGVWTGLNVWYFLRPATIAYYRKSKL